MHLKTACTLHEKFFVTPDSDTESFYMKHTSYEKIFQFHIERANFEKDEAKKAVRPLWLSTQLSE